MSVAVEVLPRQLFIAGEWRDASGGATLGVEDPSTGEVFAEVADASPADAVAALDAAVAVQEEWAQHPPRERGEILRRAYELIVARSDELALLMTAEMGKPVPESKAEVTYAADFFRWFAEEAVRIEGRFATAPTGVGRLITMKQPVGPCYAITPWNFPMAMGTRKIGPAVAAGCTMVVKPAQQTPLSMLALAQILEEAGLPAGVLNVITASSSRARVGADHLRPAAAQAHVHRLDRGRPCARRTGGAGSCCGRRWSWAATPRSSCSPTPTSTTRWRARRSRRCATWARRARRRTASTSSARSPAGSRTSSPSGSARWRSAR